MAIVEAATEPDNRTWAISFIDNAGADFSQRGYRYGEEEQLTNINENWHAPAASALEAQATIRHAKLQEVSEH